VKVKEVSAETFDYRNTVMLILLKCKMANNVKFCARKISEEEKFVKYISFYCSFLTGNKYKIKALFKR